MWELQCPPTLNQRFGKLHQLAQQGSGELQCPRYLLEVWVWELLCPPTLNQRGQLTRKTSHYLQKCQSGTSTCFRRVPQNGNLATCFTWEASRNTIRGIREQ